MADKKKWSTLKHNGILFQPKYEPLPDKVKIKYDGVPYQLNKTSIKNPFGITAEEAAVFFAMKNEQDDRLGEKDKKRHKARDDPVFVKNFWDDWKVILKASGDIATIKDFSKVDFTPIQKYIAKRSEEKKSARKSLSKEEKKKEKELKEEIKEKFGYATIDGMKIPIGSYMVQPAGLYLGHGLHPLRGKIKKRLQPSDVVINCSKGDEPKCALSDGTPCKWGEVVHRPEVTWIAMFRHPLTGESTYVFLKRDESHFVTESDMKKFEKARTLKRAITKIRDVYTKDLGSVNRATRQNATAVYLLDVLAIRPGVDKDETKEAGTLGLTTLKCSNIKFKNDSIIKINFTGKSSIQFEKTFQVTPKVYENLQELCYKNGERKKSEKIFPDINATTLNAYLKDIVPGLTAKVFRTYKASSILQNELNKLKVAVDTPVQEKKLLYDRANIAVALALNHKRLGGSSDRVEKIEKKMGEIKEKLADAKTETEKKRYKKSLDTWAMKMEEATENVATTTSKVNYLDPRIVVSWCKKVELPIEKIYNKTSLKKFVWSMSEKSDWNF